MIAYLEPVQTTPAIALQRAVIGFRQREGRMPDWVVAGAGVTLPTDEVLYLGLCERPDKKTRPAHVLVGVDTQKKND